jgi:hypothetical protein
MHRGRSRRRRKACSRCQLIVAQANKQCSIPGKDWDNKRVRRRRRRRSIWQRSPMRRSVRQARLRRSLSPVRQRSTGAMRGPAFFAYADNYLIDETLGIISGKALAFVLLQREKSFDRFPRRPAAPPNGCHVLVRHNHVGPLRRWRLLDEQCCASYPTSAGIAINPFANRIRVKQGFCGCLPCPMCA